MRYVERLFRDRFKEHMILEVHCVIDKEVKLTGIGKHRYLIQNIDIGARTGSPVAVKTRAVPGSEDEIRDDASDRSKLL